MRRLTESLVLSVAVLAVGFLVAGCGHSGTGGAIASLSPSKSISLPSRSASVPPSITATPTAQPSATQTSAPAPTEQPSASTAPASGSSSSLIWLWVAIGIVVLIAVVVLITRSAGRRSAAAASWRSRITDAYAKGSALYDAMSVLERQDTLSAEDAGARWSDIQRRADDFTQVLYAMREAAPGEEDRARVADVLAALQAARSAMDAERAPGGAGARQAEAARGRLFSFEAALRSIRPAGHRLR